MGYSIFEAVVEPHDAVYQQELRQLAARVCAQLVGGTQRPIAVMLMGSAARGPCSRSSDVDLLVLADDSDVTELRQTWQYDQSGVPLDIRIVDAGGLASLAQASDGEFLEYCSATRLPDYLRGSIHLYRDGSRRSVELTDEVIPGIVTRRFESAIRDLFAERLLDIGKGRLQAAATQLREGFPLDAHAVVLEGTSVLLESRIVAAGHQIRGAKKRIEIGRSVLTGARLAWIEWVMRCTGTDEMNLEAATELVRRRAALRSTTLNALQVVADRGDDRFGELRDRGRQHATPARDYYDDLMAHGFWRGVVNHIRVLSGVPFVPSEWCTAIGAATPHPVQTFCGELSFPEAVRTEWLHVSGLRDDGEQVADLIGEGMRLVNKTVTGHGQR